MLSKRKKKRDTRPLSRLFFHFFFFNGREVLRRAKVGRAREKRAAAAGIFPPLSGTRTRALALRRVIGRCAPDK